MKFIVLSFLLALGLSQAVFAQEKAADADKEAYFVQAQEKMLNATGTDEYQDAVANYETVFKSMNFKKVSFENTQAIDAKDWSVDPSTGQGTTKQLLAANPGEDKVVGTVMETVVDPGTLVLAGRLGVNDGPGVGVGAKATYRRYLNGNIIPTFGSLEIQAGIPVMRIFGEAQVYPIKIYQKAFQVGDDSVNVLMLSIVPLTVKGKITFNNLNTVGFGRSSFIASPDFAVSFLHVGTAGKAIFIANVGATGGIAAGVAHDYDGTGSILGPKFALRGAFAFLIKGKHRIDFKVEGITTFSVLPTINNVGSTGVSGEFNTEANYSRVFNKYGNRWFVGLYETFDRYDVGGKNFNRGPFLSELSYSFDPGITASFGAQGGVTF